MCVLLHSDCETIAAGHLGISDGQSESESASGVAQAASIRNFHVF